MEDKIRGFEVVIPTMQKIPNVQTQLPTRGTSKSAAYDIYAKQEYIVEPGEVVKIWTDIKAYMQDNEVLIINVRSSMGGNFMLANTQGWVDADYYSNETNDGNIGIFLKNMRDEPLEIMTGERIAQAMFVNYLIADSGNTDVERTGGFGSTNE